MSPRCLALGLVLVLAGRARGQQVPGDTTSISVLAGAEVPEESQPASLPALPPGMSLAFIVRGDSIFHGRGGCFACHGSEAQGLPDAGSGITYGLTYLPDPTWEAIDSLVRSGIPDQLTRSPLAMPDRGARGDLGDDQVRAVAAYVWAISHVKGEPWAGGHVSHLDLVPPGSTIGTESRHGLATAGGDTTLRFARGQVHEPGGAASVVLSWVVIGIGVVLVVWLNVWLFQGWVRRSRRA